jgi:hypothetical protein
MTDPIRQKLNAKALQNLNFHKPEQCTCALKHCKGWESVSDDRWPADQMQARGTLREEQPEGQTEPTFEEFHPQGTRYDSPRAPIALKYFPYNRCDVFACTKCGSGALKYTEYGGYYVDHRVRLIDPDLLVHPSLEVAN